jgi:hypothetical protein
MIAITYHLCMGIIAGCFCNEEISNLMEMARERDC